MFHLEDKYHIEKQQLLLIIYYQQFLILKIQLYYEFKVDFQLIMQH